MASQREWEKKIWRHLATELESMTHEELIDQIADKGYFREGPRAHC
jgi:hypothetical protein